MLRYGKIDYEESEDLVQNGALKPDTLQRRKKVGDDFTKFVEGTLSMPVKGLTSGDRAHRARRSTGKQSCP